MEVVGVLLAIKYTHATSVFAAVKVAYCIWQLFIFPSMAGKSHPAPPILHLVIF
jgi:hypothetical protein